MTEPLPAKIQGKYVYRNPTDRSSVEAWKWLETSRDLSGIRRQQRTFRGGSSITINEVHKVNTLTRAGRWSVVSLTVMTNDIDIAIFKEFARLEDPYECARYEAKQDILQPFKRQIYVGRIDPVNADVPVGPKPSTSRFLKEAQEPYPLLQVDVTAVGSDFEQRQTQARSHRSTVNVKPTTESGLRVRGALDNHGKWDEYMYQFKWQKALKSDAGNPAVPACLSWSISDVISWLREIGMDKYEETFLANEIDGTRLCDLDMNRLIKTGVHSWDDLKAISKELKLLTKRPARPWFYLRDTSIPPMDDIDLYLEFKNVHGDQSETTGFAQFAEENRDTLWSYPEKTLRYPGMIYQNNHAKRITTNVRY